MVGKYSIISQWNIGSEIAATGALLPSRLNFASALVFILAMREEEGVVAVKEAKVANVQVRSTSEFLHHMDAS
jgi:hypothetical protein